MKRGMPPGSYLANVCEQDFHLDETTPIFVEHGIFKKDDAIAPRCHPSLEFGIRFKGVGSFFIEGEAMMRRPYDVYLGAMNQPHWGTIRQYPVEFVSVHFLPSILSEWGTEDEGISILDRFVAEQPLSKQLVRPPPFLRKRLALGFHQMLAEFHGRDFWRMLKLQALLAGLLVDLLRWERRSGSWLEGSKATSGDWKHVMQAMRYIRQHYSKVIYGHDVVGASGLSKARLCVAFRQTLKIPWVRYLQLYRVHRAAMLLRTGRHNVTEAAMACGFESLSHFIRTFRSHMGASPRSYLAKVDSKKAKNMYIKGKTRQKGLGIVRFNE